MPLIGLDVSTTGATAVCLETSTRSTHEYPLSTPRPLWSEQNPDDWVEAARASLRDVGDGTLGVTGQMHGLVLLDARNRVLRPAILWNDQRTVAECAEIERRVPRVREITGNPVLPGFTAPKLLWVRRHELDTYARIAKVLLPKDYVRFRLTGEMLTDVSDASGTSLFDVGARRWSADILDALEVPRAWLPDVVESPGYGAGDCAAAAIACGVFDEGVTAVSIGTSGVVFAATRAFRPDARLHAFCHAQPGMWHRMGVLLSAGGSLRWFRDAFGGTYDELCAEAATVETEGLIFLPHLSGERTNPDSRGVFFGLTLRHGRAHMARAVLEGVAFGLRDFFESMRGDEVRLTGGGARSALWRQIVADALGVPVVVADGDAATGAAMLAGGVRDVRLEERIEPARSMDEPYERFRALYASTLTTPAATRSDGASPSRR